MRRRDERSDNDRVVQALQQRPLCLSGLILPRGLKKPARSRADVCGIRCGAGQARPPFRARRSWRRGCAVTRANIRRSPPNSRQAGAYLRPARRNPATAAGLDRRGRHLRGATRHIRRHPRRLERSGHEAAVKFNPRERWLLRDGIRVVERYDPASRSQAQQKVAIRSPRRRATGSS
jgi:hypothetical protein